jgi:ubiquinone/menaquinone biosynthesis C-methylase UbiE
MDLRKHEEKAFHDRLRTGSYGQRWSPKLEKLVQQDPLWANMKYYSIERRSRKIIEDWLICNTKNKVVLDYCCGNGDDSFFAAQCGAAKVIGIDISDVSIANCIERSRIYNYSGITTFKVMDAEQLDFEESVFDVVSEYGALHHVDLERAFASVARVLKPDGKMICVEALGHNRLIHQYRKMTKELRTQWELEHILRRNDIEKAYRYFHKVDYLGFFHMATLAAVPFRNTMIFEKLLGLLEKADNFLLESPFLKWHAWQVVFVLSQPKKAKLEINGPQAQNA